MFRRIALFALFAALCAGPAVAAPTPPVDVAIETGMGTIVVRLDPAHAPATTKNFLRYVDRGAYDGAQFYRSVRTNDPAYRATIGVLQGGLAPVRKPDVFPPIAMEPTRKTGLHNAYGTIAMARGTDPDTATSEFFINAVDNRGLDADRFGDTFGYAVFGRVIAGMEVVARIQAGHSDGETLQPAIRIDRIRRLAGNKSPG